MWGTIEARRKRSRALASKYFSLLHRAVSSKCPIWRLIPPGSSCHLIWRCSAVQCSAGRCLLSREGRTSPACHHIQLCHPIRNQHHDIYDDWGGGGCDYDRENFLGEDPGFFIWPSFFYPNFGNWLLGYYFGNERTQAADTQVPSQEEICWTPGLLNTHNQVFHIGSDLYYPPS